METKFYTGSYTLTMGQPYVIISAEDRETHFFAEKIIIFEGAKGVELLGSYVTYPKIFSTSQDDIFKSELQVCKDDIFYKILHEKYNDYLEKRGYNVKVDLHETDSSLISFFKYKFPTELGTIKAKTSNSELKALIEFHQSIKIIRDGFDFK